MTNHPSSISSVKPSSRTISEEEESNEASLRGGRRGELRRRRTGLEIRRVAIREEKNNDKENEAEDDEEEVTCLTPAKAGQDRLKSEVKPLKEEAEVKNRVLIEFGKPIRVAKTDKKDKVVSSEPDVIVLDSDDDDDDAAPVARRDEASIESSWTAGVNDKADCERPRRKQSISNETLRRGAESLPTEPAVENADHPVVLESEKLNRPSSSQTNSQNDDEVSKEGAVSHAHEDFEEALDREIETAERALVLQSRFEPVFSQIQPQQTVYPLRPMPIHPSFSGYATVPTPMFVPVMSPISHQPSAQPACVNIQPEIPQLFPSTMSGSATNFHVINPSSILNFQSVAVCTTENKTDAEIDVTSVSPLPYIGQTTEHANVFLQNYFNPPPDGFFPFREDLDKDSSSSSSDTESEKSEVDSECAEAQVVGSGGRKSDKTSSSRAIWTEPREAAGTAPEIPVITPHDDDDGGDKKDIDESNDSPSRVVVSAKPSELVKSNEDSATTAPENGQEEKVLGLGDLMQKLSLTRRRKRPRTQRKRVGGSASPATSSTRNGSRRREERENYALTTARSRAATPSPPRLEPMTPSNANCSTSESEGREILSKIPEIVSSSPCGDDGCEGPVMSDHGERLRRARRYGKSRLDLTRSKKRKRRRKMRERLVVIGMKSEDECEKDGEESGD